MRSARPQVGYKNSNDQATIFYDRRRNWRSFSLKTRQYRHSEGRWDRSHGWACCLYNTVESVKRQQWKKNLYCKNIHYSCQLGCGVFSKTNFVEFRGQLRSSITKKKKIYIVEIFIIHVNRVVKFLQTMLFDKILLDLSAVL